MELADMARDTAAYRRISIGFIWSKISEFDTKTGEQVFETKVSIITNLVTGKKKWNIKRRIACELLYHEPCPPVPFSSDFKLFFSCHLQHVK